jgi:hypothetical protein
VAFFQLEGEHEIELETASHVASQMRLLLQWKIFNMISFNLELETNIFLLDI